MTTNPSNSAIFTRNSFRVATPARIFLSVALLFVGAGASAQQKPAPDLSNRPTAEPGDAPDNAGPLATDLSASITRRDMGKAMQRVADWQLQRLPAEA